MIPEYLVNGLRSLPELKIKKCGALTSVISISGGSINQCYKLDYESLSFFLKLNNAGKYPGMFAKEAAGLDLIKSTSAIATPEIIGTGTVEKDAFLLLEWVEPGHADEGSQEALGRQLAALHRCSGPMFGLEHDNYIGSLFQSNRQYTNWAEFYIAERLVPQLELAERKALVNAELLRDFDKLYPRLPDLFQPEAPSLIHGDLWSGNYLIRSDCEPYLIDPAVYYGNREMDIAMSTLFGGFSKTFYSSYNEAFPLQPGWQKRLDLWNLYPLLVHVNLFGQDYVQQVKEAIKLFL